MIEPIPLALAAAWSLSLRDLAVLAGLPVMVAVSVFVLTVIAITHDAPEDRHPLSAEHNKGTPVRSGRVPGIPVPSS